MKKKRSRLIKSNEIASSVMTNIRFLHHWTGETEQKDHAFEEDSTKPNQNRG